MPKDEYRDFQERIFDEIRDIEDAELNDERNRQRWARSSALFDGKVYGLTENEVLALYKDGMTGREWREAIVAARKRDWPPVGYRPGRRLTKRRFAALDAEARRGERHD